MNLVIMVLCRYVIVGYLDPWGLGLSKRKAGPLLVPLVPAGRSPGMGLRGQNPYEPGSTLLLRGSYRASIGSSLKGYYAQASHTEF